MRFLHDHGYTFSGPATLYDLSLVEIDSLLIAAHQRQLGEAGVPRDVLTKMERLEAARA